MTDPDSDPEDDPTDGEAPPTDGEGPPTEDGPAGSDPTAGEEHSNAGAGTAPNAGEDEQTADAGDDEPTGDDRWAPGDDPDDGSGGDPGADGDDDPTGDDRWAPGEDPESESGAGTDDPGTGGPTGEGSDGAGAVEDLERPPPDGDGPVPAGGGGGTLSRVPGGAASVGAGVVGAALGFLALPFGVVLPGIAFPLIDQAILFVLYAMVLLGLNLQFGDTGLINFGPVLFLGLGLYGMALVSADTPKFAAATGLDQFWGLGLLAGVVLAVVGGLIVGGSSLRLRADYLAITTLAAAEIFEEFVRVFQTPFGGNDGILGVPKLVAETDASGGVLRLAENAATRELGVLLLFAGLLLVAYEPFRRLSNSPYGRVLRSIQADEDAARGLGKPTLRYKIQAFVYGAIVAGVAGGLMGMYFGAADPGLIVIDVTVIIWIGMMIGGAGNHRGAIVGLAIVMFFELGIRLLNAPVTGAIEAIDAARFNALRGLLIGALLVLVIRFRPAGLFGDEETLEVFK